MPELKNPETEPPRVLTELGDQLDFAFHRAELEKRIAQTPPAAPRHGRRRGFAIAIAMLATLAILASLIVGIDRSGHQIGLDEALADVARNIDVAPNPGPDQYEYTRSVASYLGWMPGGVDYRGRSFDEFVFLRSRTQSSWLSTTREGAAVAQAGKPSFPTARDAALGEAYFEALRFYLNAQRTHTHGAELREINRKILAFNRTKGLDGFGFPEADDVERMAVGPAGGTFVGNELLSEKELAEFPREPKALYARVRAGVEKQVAKDQKYYATLPKDRQDDFDGNPDADEEIWEMLSVGNQFGHFPMPRDLRAAMVRALAELPGVRYEGDAEDRFGRKGERFSWDHKGKRYSVLFDRDTSVLLSASTEIVDPGSLAWKLIRRLPPGTVISRYQMIEQKTVGSVPPAAKQPQLRDYSWMHRQQK